MEQEFVCFAKGFWYTLPGKCLPSVSELAAVNLSIYS
jgi:hypothetical protein